MSIVLPGRGRRTDFLAPSKALQDAKEVLGPVYFDAKLVECPQNAVELSKLIKEWDELDKQRFKAVEEVRRGQRVLIHTLNSRYTFSKSSVSLDSLSSVRDVKLPPPGFRFHANGKQKLVLGNEQSAAKLNSLLDLERQRMDEENEENDAILDKTVIDSYRPTESTILRSAVSTPANIGAWPSNSTTTTADGEVDEKTIQKLKRDIEDVLIASDVNLGFYRSTQQLLRNDSSKQVASEPSVDTVTEPVVRRPNDRFAFMPGTSSFTKTESKINELYKPKIKYPICSKCSACRYKLQHSDVEFRKLQENLSNPKFRRWNIAPQGKMVENPQFSPRLSAGTRSVSSLGRLGSGNSVSSNLHVTVNENNESLTDNTRVSEKVGRRVSIARSQTAKVSEKRRSSKTQAHSSRNIASAYQIEPHSKESATSQRDLQISLRRAASAYSPSRAASRLDSSLDFFKSIAAEEGKECNDKVKDFLKRLKEKDEKKSLVKMAFL